MEHTAGDARHTASVLRAVDGVDAAAHVVRNCSFGAATAGRGYAAQGAAVRDGRAGIVAALSAWATRSTTSADAVVHAADTLAEQDDALAVEIRSLHR